MRDVPVETLGQMEILILPDLKTIVYSESSSLWPWLADYHDYHDDCVWCFRNFVEQKYVALKKANPDLPILIRECSGVQARLWARYGE